MPDEFVQAKWARTAVESIERAISEWNNQHRTRVPIRVVWGHANKEDAEAEREIPKARQCHNGLINLLRLDFELLISQHGDPDHPNRCHIRTRFQEPQPLPLTPRDLYNVMRCCDDAISLSVHPNMESDGILVSGVETCVPVENLTGRALHDALSRLSTSHNLAFERLAKRSGDDHWAMDGGAERIAFYASCWVPHQERDGASNGAGGTQHDA
jgi:hypothetical protein